MSSHNQHSSGHNNKANEHHHSENHNHDSHHGNGHGSHGDDHGHHHAERKSWTVTTWVLILVGLTIFFIAHGLITGNWW